MKTKLILTHFIIISSAVFFLNNKVFEHTVLWRETIS